MLPIKHGRIIPLHSGPWSTTCMKCRSISTITSIIQEHMEMSQREQWWAYNQPAQPQEFQPGDQVLLLLPKASYKFLACWQEHYTILERVGPVNYCLQQPSKHTDTQLYYANLQKKNKLIQPVPVRSAFSAVLSEPNECTLFH